MHIRLIEFLLLMSVIPESKEVISFSHCHLLHFSRLLSTTLHVLSAYVLFPAFFAFSRVFVPSLKHLQQSKCVCRAHRSKLNKHLRFTAPIYYPLKRNPRSVAPLSVVFRPTVSICALLKNLLFFYPIRLPLVQF